MRTLYDSEDFIVVHIQAETPAATPAQPGMVRHGFEIVDKRSNKEIYLDGSWAELFQRQIHAWQVATPTQEEVEETLSGYAGLAQTPISMH